MRMGVGSGEIFEGGWEMACMWGGRLFGGGLLI